MKKNRLLMVEDSASLAAIYMSYLADTELDVRIVDTLAKARQEVECFQPDVVLLDIELPDGQGLDLLRNPPEIRCPPEVVVMTAFGSNDLAANAIRLGAFDYLSKPFDADRLHVTLANALDHKRLNTQVEQFTALSRDQYCDFIGHSLPMQAVYRIIDSVSASDATAFIVGESGTGKELTANAIHQQSKRRDATFLALNCAAIPKDLMESELFGHVKGAFTGATSTREGAASLADGGTLFLDEICEMDLDLQSKMLRFIQTGQFQKVGSNTVEVADIRFVCATNRDPMTEVATGRFREDLYYRLHVIPIELPSLRERGDDVLLIAEAFLEQYNSTEQKGFRGFDESARRVLAQYEWPGNVRELQNVIHNTVVLNDEELVTSEMLSLQKPRKTVSEVEKPATTHSHLISRLDIEPLWLVERRTIEAAISRCDGNINRAAGLLEVSPSTIYRKLQSWEKSGQKLAVGG